MKSLIIDIITEESKKLIIESGIKDISKLSKRYQKAKIYFHQDLDGVTTALGMKSYLEQNGIKVVDSEIIQYGDKEFAIKKLDAEGDVMPVLVDFAHGKPMFVIHTDHHDTQAGVEQGTSTNFKSSRSNVETISQTVSPKDIFPTEDINLISTVDSANYAKYDITPEEVMNYLFKVDKNKTLQQNKMMMGMVTNKLLLAFKNKPEFLENIVMNANPSLLSILNYIKSQIKERGYADVDSLSKNKEDYVKSMKTNKNVKVDGSIIVQYGGGSMMKPGSYDRYTPFRNNPDADFLVIAWPLGLVQASCNPFKKERALKGINLGEIKDVVLNKWRSQLESKDIPLSTIKWISESGKSFGEDSVGFTFKDFNALYGKEFKNMENGEEMLKNIDQVMKKPFTSLSDNEMMVLDNISVNAWDLITANSGGHKCITNISGLSYLGRSKRPPQGKYKYDSESEDSPYVKFTKMLQNEFVRVLKEKIDSDTEVMDDSDSYAKMDESSFRVNKGEMIKNPLKYINKNILNETTSKLKQLLTEEEKRSWSKGIFNNGDGVKTPKITINKSNNFFDISYKGPESGFNIESAVLNLGDSIHQLSNVFTYEVNKHLKDLYQKEIYVKPDMESIEMVKTPNFFKIKVNFDETDKENAITKIERRGGMGHSATKGKSLMEEKCNKYSGCKKVYTIKSGSITEHFISYIDKPKQEGEETESDVDLITNLEKIHNQKETFKKQKKPYPVEKDVKLLQTALQFLGFSLPQWGVDGRFGPETEKAVKDFQEKYSLDVTGIVDQETMGKIIEKMDESDFENEDMNKIQKNKVEYIKNDTKTKVEDIKNDTKNIIIGDSITPHLTKAAGTGFSSGPKALSISDYSGVGLWYGGIGLTGIQKMADSYKTVHPKVKNVVITIGTNGYGGTGGVSALATNLKRIFPNAKLFVCQGAYGLGWKSTPYSSLSKYTDKYINTFYKAFTDAGITVVPYPIKDTVTEVHTPNVPVYKKWVSFINNNAN